MRLFISTTLTLLVCLLLAPPSIADQDDAPALPEGAIVFSKPKAALYDKLLIIDENDRSGGGSQAKSDKHRFLHLRMVINYQLPDEADSISIGSDELHLVEDGGKKHPSVGSFDDNKIFSNWVHGFWLHSGNNPLFPALRSGHRLFQGPPAESKFLALFIVEPALVVKEILA